MITIGIPDVASDIRFNSISWEVGGGVERQWKRKYMYMIIFGNRVLIIVIHETSQTAKVPR